MGEKPRWWILSAFGGYQGEWAVFETEEDAEQIRRAKATWEQCVVRKRKADGRQKEDKLLIAQASKES
jgi:hypothetical protein